jgi:hypothetical protein
MQINYDTISLPKRAVLVPFPESQRQIRSPQPTCTNDLVTARREVLRAQSFESMVWLAVAASSLAVLLTSLWA